MSVLSHQSVASPDGADGKLWYKGYLLAPAIEDYEAASNAALDAQLARHDIWGSLAHARMLRAVGLITSDDWQALDAGLRDLLAEAEQGRLQPGVAEEDVHTLIERLLIERIGAAGKQLHIGRSRNDQALVDLRLYAKETLLDLADALLRLARTLLTQAQTHEWTPMPGYTHMQRAMLSSVGLWASAHAEALLDDEATLATAYALNDASPLGSAAAYGAPLPLDRPLVARLLGFAGVHHNVLTAANARGKLEAAVVQALALVMLDLSKFAQDALLFTTSEFAFFTAPQNLCDGSSIMPQKRNLSALELVRARAQRVIALQSQMLATLAGLPSGYNMDYQETKAPLLEAAQICQSSLEVVALFAAGLQPNAERMAAACTPDLFAADDAYELAASGVPFRDAYRQIAAHPADGSPGDLRRRLAQRTAVGAPGNLELDKAATRIVTLQQAWTARRQNFTQAITALTSGQPIAIPLPPVTGASAGFSPAHEIALGI